jgi:hypothetical protein
MKNLSSEGEMRDFRGGGDGDRGCGGGFGEMVAEEVGEVGVEVGTCRGIGVEEVVDTGATTEGE